MEIMLIHKSASVSKLFLVLYINDVFEPAMNKNRTVVFRIFSSGHVVVIH